MKKNSGGHLEDEEVIEIILRDKNPRLFEIIYDRYASKVYFKCLSFVYDKRIAEDLSHDILIKVYLSLNKFSGKSKFSTWLFSVTFNHCIDHVKKNKKRVQELDHYREDKLNSLEEYKESTDEELFEIKVERLKTVLPLIPEEEKFILLLKYQDGLMVKNIALVTNLSESAVKMRLKRGRERILKLYKDRYSHNIV